MFWQLALAGQSSCETPVASLLRSSRNSLASQTSSRKKDLEKFQIFQVFSIFATHFDDWFTSGSSSRQFTQNASQLLLRLLASGPFSRKKHLDKFFKTCHTGFWRLDLATCSRLILVAKNTCFAQIGLNPRQFSKTFQFSFASRAISLSCPPLLLPKPPFSLTKPPFSSSILHQSSRNGMGFLFFFKVFHVSSP